YVLVQRGSRIGGDGLLEELGGFGIGMFVESGQAPIIRVAGQTGPLPDRFGKFLFGQPKRLGLAAQCLVGRGPLDSCACGPGLSMVVGSYELHPAYAWNHIFDPCVGVWARRRGQSGAGFDPFAGLVLRLKLRLPSTKDAAQDASALEF